MKYKTVLVLGGTGFLGKNLQKVRPDWIYMGRSEWVENGVICGGEIPPYDFTKYEDVYNIINNFNPDAVINLAADVGGIVYNNDNQLTIFENNMLMNTNILKACRELEIERVLSCLSTCVFPCWEKQSSPMWEGDFWGMECEYDQPPVIHPYKGHRGYGWSKRMLHMHTELAREVGYNYSTFAPSNLYGPHDHIGQTGAHFVASLIDKIDKLDSKELHLHGDGRALRQFLYAPDLAQIIPILLEKHNTGIPIIVAPDENLSIHEMATQALKSLNKEAEIVYSGEHKGQFRKDCTNVMLKELIGEFSFTSFSEGIKATFNWYKENK